MTSARALATAGAVFPTTRATWSSSRAILAGRASICRTPLRFWGTFCSPQWSDGTDLLVLQLYVVRQRKKSEHLQYCNTLTADHSVLSLNTSAQGLHLGCIAESQ